MKEKQLIVSEVFYSLQCEGRSIGTPAVFLRLAGCNLLCESKTWRCDTIEVWQKGRATFFPYVLYKLHVDRLKTGAHLVITGGEPLLHQTLIIDYLSWFLRTYDFIPFIEIETNGTIVPHPSLINVVKYWNVSPKLANSGEPPSKRINETAIDSFNKLDNSIFKFVIGNMPEIFDILQDYPSIKGSKVWLMPAGSTQDELNEVRIEVAETAIKFGYNYSERLHIVIWNKKTGV